MFFLHTITLWWVSHLFCILFLFGYLFSTFSLPAASVCWSFLLKCVFLQLLPFLCLDYSIWQPVYLFPPPCISVSLSASFVDSHTLFCYCQLTCLQGMDNFSKVKFKSFSSYLMTSSESLVGPLSTSKISYHIEIIFFTNFFSRDSLSFLSLSGIEMLSWKEHRGYIVKRQRTKWLQHDE